MDNVIWGVPSFWIERIPLYYAEDQGILEDYDLDLTIEYFYGGPELCGAVNTGRIRLGSMGFPPFAKAYAEGMPARIIGSTILQQLDHYLVARPEIGSVADLRGKKIGVLSAGSCDSYFIRRMLLRAGVDPDTDVELVAMGKALGGDLTCFSSGQIDAGFVVEPKISLGERQDLFRVLARVGDYYPRYQWGIIFAREDYLETHLETIRKVLEAYRTAAMQIQADPDGCIGLGSRVFGVPPDVFRKALERNLTHWAVDGQVDLEGMENALEIQKEMGVVERDTAVDDMLYAL
jgi:NitT/TauT family transport system substrate-binding protein